MKRVNKVIVVMLFTFGIQHVALGGRIGSKMVVRGLRNTGKTLWSGFETVMRSGINFRELNRKIKERQELSGYADIK